MKNARTVLTLAAFVAAATMIASAQTSVFVPGNTGGGFGNPIDIVVPLVPAITVSGPSRITVTYVSGTVSVGAGFADNGPNGIKWNFNGAQSPLQEARGASGGTANNLGALIGVFVPASKRVAGSSSQSMAPRFWQEMGSYPARSCLSVQARRFGCSRQELYTSASTITR